MRGVSFPHPPRMRHDGMQEECSDEENEQSLIKFMTENSEVIPESSPARKKRKFNRADRCLLEICSG